MENWKWRIENGELRIENSKFLIECKRGVCVER